MLWRTTHPRGIYTVRSMSWWGDGWMDGWTYRWIPCLPTFSRRVFVLSSILVLCAFVRFRSCKVNVGADWTKTYVGLVVVVVVVAVAVTVVVIDDDDDMQLWHVVVKKWYEDMYVYRRGIQILFYLENKKQNVKNFHFHDGSWCYVGRVRNLKKLWWQTCKHSIKHLTQLLVSQRS